jgi:hypothetical protein
VHESGSIETTYIDVAAREVWAVTPPHSKKMPDIPRSSKLEMATATSTEAQENRNFSKRSNPDSQSNTSFKYDVNLIYMQNLDNPSPNTSLSTKFLSVIIRNKSALLEWAIVIFYL